MNIELIFGATRQEGGHLAQLLLCKVYDRHGIGRRSSQLNSNCADQPHKQAPVARQRFRPGFNDRSESANLILALQQVQHAGACDLQRRPP